MSVQLGVKYALASGTTGTFTGDLTAVSVTTTASGVASAPGFTANGMVGGPYNVIATIGTGLQSARFSLTNTKGGTATGVNTSANPSDLGQSVT